MAKRHNTQLFGVTAGVQANPLDALRTALFAASSEGATPAFNLPAELGVDLGDVDSVAIAVSTDANETVDAGDLVAFVYGPVDINPNGSIKTQRWCSIGANKAIPVGIRDGLVVFNKHELPGAGRLLVLPSGVQTSAGATGVRLTYSARRRST